MKGRLTNLLNRLKADITQDNMTKAGIAEQTVQHALAGIQEAVTLNPSLPEAEQENTADGALCACAVPRGQRKEARRPAVRSAEKGMIV